MGLRGPIARLPLLSDLKPSHFCSSGRINSAVYVTETDNVHGCRQKVYNGFRIIHATHGTTLCLEISGEYFSYIWSVAFKFVEIFYKKTEAGEQKCFSRSICGEMYR